MSNSTEPIVKSADIPEESQSILLEISKTAVKDNTKAIDISNEIKSKLDEKLGSPWHVIVGKSFGSSVSHEKGGFIYFYIDNWAILCFKTA